MEAEMRAKLHICKEVRGRAIVYRQNASRLRKTNIEGGHRQDRYL